MLCLVPIVDLLLIVSLLTVVSHCSTFPAPSGLVSIRVLLDKRHVLTKDSEGIVQLWDVLAGAPIQQLGQVGMQKLIYHSVALISAQVHADSPRVKVD